MASKVAQVSSRLARFSSTVVLSAMERPPFSRPAVGLDQVTDHPAADRRGGEPETSALITEADHRLPALLAHQIGAQVIHQQDDSRTGRFNNHIRGDGEFGFHLDWGQIQFIERAPFRASSRVHCF
ncbi:MAG TPA: hypothetical protein VGG50_11580 [Streptosporangiaceae bacterium]